MALLEQPKSDRSHAMLDVLTDHEQLKRPEHIPADHKLFMALHDAAQDAITGSK